jgi:hypothetical protein
VKLGKNMKAVKTIHKYKLITANEFLCIPACIEMILRSHSINFMQNEIAEYFGVNVSLDYTGPINNIMRTTDLNILGLVLNNDSINNFFANFNLPFKEEYVSIKKLQDWMFEDLLSEKIALGNHLICGFSYGGLYNDKSKFEIGHVSIIEAIENEKITIIDPGPLNTGKKQVDIFDMFRAIHMKNDGVWIISQVR